LSIIIQAHDFTYLFFEAPFINQFNSYMKLDNIFAKLWNDYTSQNPDVKKVFDLFTGRGEKVLNDHIAFRTFNDSRINIDVLSEVFQKNGYVHKGSYHFNDKHLFARHFELPADPFAPRVFISELITEDFSPFLRNTVKDLVGKIPLDVLNSENIIFSGRTWGKPSFETYEALRKESEYAAWVYVFGFRANHFTVNCNALSTFNSLQEVNSFLKDNGFKLNSAGGEIKGTPAELLEQSSTLAGSVPVEFIEGGHDIPSCYYEFALRYPDKYGQLFSGFIALSADKIFESTDLR